MLKNMRRANILTSSGGMFTALCMTCLLCQPPLARADIYRFVTVDGVESFTDAPLKKNAQIVIKDEKRAQRKTSMRSLSRAITRKQPAPSLQEIVDKTIQTQVSSGEDKATTTETTLPVNGPITSVVGMRIDPFDGTWRHHNGIDIAVPDGTPVKAVANGTVLYSGLRSGYGWTVLVEHDNGMITLYAHNSRITAEAGQLVKRGETIALSGNTGRSTGPHVHFEAWQAGANITPAFLPGSGIKIAAIPGYVHRAKPHFRKEVLADGSLLITNLPHTVR